MNYVTRVFQQAYKHNSLHSTKKGKELIQLFLADAIPILRLKHHLHQSLHLFLVFCGQQIFIKGNILILMNAVVNLCLRRDLHPYFLGPVSDIG